MSSSAKQVKKDSVPVHTSKTGRRYVEIRDVVTNSAWRDEMKRQSDSFEERRSKDASKRDDDRGQRG